MRLVVGVAYFLLPVLLVQARSSSDDANEWDVLIFTQQWPISSCMSHLQHPGHHTCNLYPNMTTWTVHGIWPTKLGTIGPNFCNNSWIFIEEEVIPIEGMLVKYWGNIFGEDSPTSLWKHEWLKHGTCAAQLEELDTERKYFQKGLDWVMKHDLIVALAQHDIYPSDLNSYTLDQLFTAVKDAFGVNPFINCFFNKHSKRHELWQVKLCFNKSVALVDCDGIVLQRGGARGLEEDMNENSEREAMGNCPTDSIIYPSSVSAGGRLFVYPRTLVERHVQQKQLGLARCDSRSWVCRALLTVFSLKWITL